MSVDEEAVKDRTTDAQKSDEKWIIHIISYNSRGDAMIPEGLINGFFVAIHEVNVGDLASLRIVQRNTYVEITTDRENAARFDSKEDADKQVEIVKQIPSQADNHHTQLLSIQPVRY